MFIALEQTPFGNFSSKGFLSKVAAVKLNGQEFALLLETLSEMPVGHTTLYNCAVRNESVETAKTCVLC